MTSYDTIYELFSQKITAYVMLDLSDEDLRVLMLHWLKSSIVKTKKCRNDLSNKDDGLQAFNIDLDDVEIEILACLMVAEWITPQLNSTAFTSQYFGGKDEKFFAQSNQINALRLMKKDMQIEARKLRRDYITNTSSYLNN
jgi:hypothetical protein